MPHLLRAAAAIALIAGLVVTAPAFGHEIDPRHTASIMVLPADDGWEVRAALLLELPPNARSLGLVAQYDLNRSGKIEAAEGRMLADALGPEAVGGFVLTAGDSAPIPESVDGLASSDGDGRIRLAVLLTYMLPSTVERIGVRVLERPGGGRVEARPVFLTIELAEGDEVQTLLPTLLKRPGDEASEVALPSRRDSSESESDEEEKPEASPAEAIEPAALPGVSTK